MNNVVDMKQYNFDRDMEAIRALIIPRPRAIVQDEKTRFFLRNRIYDLEQLARLRQGKEMDYDMRKEYLFIYAMHVAQVQGLEAAKHKIEWLNYSFHRQIDESTIIFANIYEVFENGRGYKYKNETIIERLGITAEEQQQLKVLAE